MCTVNPDGGLVVMPEESSLIKKLDPICRKCLKDMAIVVLQKKFQYCLSCLDDLVSHKVFSALGKERIMKPTDKVLALCSGSQSSSLMLHLLKTGIETRKKRILSELSILFIDDGCFIPSTVKSRISLVNDIKEMADYYSLKCYYSPLVFSAGSTMSMDSLDWCTEEYLRSHELSGLFESISSSTSQLELLNKLRVSVAINVAKELNCNKIFSAETADHMACRILSNIALGRGDQLPHDIGLTDCRYEIPLVRPLKDCTKKEVVIYRHSMNLPYVLVPKLETMTAKPESIQKVTEKFVADLQANFPSTVSAVIGTGKKLDVSSAEVKNTCLLCKSDISVDSNSLSAIKARELSHTISTLGINGYNSDKLSPNAAVDSRNNTCSTEVSTQCGKCSCSKTSMTANEFHHLLCYGCQLVISEMKDLSKLPAKIISELQSQKRLEEMKNEIKDFLLE